MHAKLFIETISVLVVSHHPAYTAFSFLYTLPHCYLLITNALCFVMDYVKLCVFSGKYLF